MATGQIKSAIGAALVYMAALLPTSSIAQESEVKTSQQYLDYLAGLSRQAETRVRSRASTLGIPSGFVTPKNVGFIAVAVSDRRERGTKREPDGSMAIGFGFGDATRSVGGEFVLGISSLGAGTGDETFDASDVGDSGSASGKIGRHFKSPFGSGVAGVSVGVGRAGRWGDVTRTDPSYYIAGSSTFLVPTNNGSLQGLVTAGLATSIGTGEDEDGAFFGAGLGVNEWLSVGGSFYGDEAILGVTTFHKLNTNVDLQFGLSYGDVTRENSDGRIMFSIALINNKLFGR